MASNQAPKSEGEPPYDLATCRQFLLANGERVVYAPDHVQWKESKKAFVGKTVRWNPDKSTAGTLKTRIARELLDDEKSSEISWDGPTENSPAALYRLRGTWEEGLYTRPYDPTAPRWILPRRPVAPLPPRDDPVFADACKRLDLANCRQFLLSNLHRVVYAPEDLQTRIEHQDLDFVGKKLNWITEYWTMDKSFPSVQRELYGEEKSTVFSPAGPDVDKPTSPYKLDGSIRTGLFVRVDQGKPPPTQEQRDIFDVDLTACREFLMDNGVHVLYIGGTADIRNRAVNQDFTDKEVRFNSISGETSTPRIVRELQGSEKTPVLSKGEPSEDNPTHPYLLRGTLNSLYTNPHTPRTLLDDAQARRVASANEDFDRFYAASSKRSDVSSCREFLLSNGERVIYVPKTVSLGDKYRDESFEGVELHWNPDREMLGQKKVYVVREVEEGERSAVRSPDGPTADMPSAPHLLTGTINGGLHTLPPRYPLRLTAPPSSEVIPAGELGAQDAGRLFPVICSTSIPAEFKDRLLDANTTHHSFLVLVESLTEKYLDESSPGDSVTNTSSPFQEKTPLECAHLLRELRRETGSDINFEYFVIVDARSLEDETVLTVEAVRADEAADSDGETAAADEDDDPNALRILTLRAEMKLINGQFLYYGVRGTMQEDIERLEFAGPEDGVLRDLWA